jgi:3-dehydroquinate synthase
MRTVKVALGARSYPIHIGAGALDKLGKECRKQGFSSRCAIISDQNVAPIYAERAEAILKKSGFAPTLIIIPAGEKAKSLKQVAQCYDTLAGRRLERRSFIVALGGGVVGDLAGFVAATYLRGLPFVQVPTTLLAQVDSSVGGKVGVNLGAGKNLVGAFHQPRVVLCDLDTLQTLPEREFKAGLAEVIKYGIIYDARLFSLLERELPQILRKQEQLLQKIIARCCEIKAEVVARDETETGERAILNFGHTIGHALEAITRYGKLLHGEAISVGQVAAAWLSTRLTGLPEEEAARIERIFQRAGLPTRMSLSARQFEQMLAAMKLDKKVSSGEIKFVLAGKIGAVKWGHAVPEPLIRQAPALH